MSSARPERWTMHKMCTFKLAAHVLRKVLDPEAAVYFSAACTIVYLNISYQLVHKAVQ